MSSYKRKVENTYYIQEYAHCNGKGLKKCSRCFRYYLSCMLPKMGIERYTAIKPEVNGEDCMIFVDIERCPHEVDEVEKRVALYKDSQMDAVDNNNKEEEENE